MKDCEYRLPCNWCDKFNRVCDEAEYEINQQMSEIINCDHEWLIIETTETTGGTENTYRCSKCGAIRKKCFDGSVYVSCNSSDVRDWL